MKKLNSVAVLVMICVIVTSCSQKRNQNTATTGTKKDTILLADPTIFLDNNTYYLYGTNSPDGFLVYTSDNLQDWTVPLQAADGLALRKGESCGTKGFWAPQIFRYRDKYYMAYTADENIAIAESDSPAGPFRQKEFSKIESPTRQIDPFVFFDDDGKIYLYHVRLTNGNRIFVAEMTDDLSAILEETVTECITATEGWEDTQRVEWTVAEGPTVIKHNGLYYLFYSANDFRNIDYAVGYAVSESPYGPWKKTEESPIISRHNVGFNGAGHGDFFLDKDNNWKYVFHIHNSPVKVSMRKTAIVSGAFVPDSQTGYDRMVINPETVFFPFH